MSDSGFDPAELFGLRRGPGRPRPRLLRSGPHFGRGRRIAAIVAAIVVVAVVAFFSLVGLRVQYLFLDANGHSGVFWTPLVTKALCFLVGAVVVGGLVGLCVRGWVRAAQTVDERGRSYAIGAGLVIVALSALAGGGFLSSQWQQILLFLHRSDFHQNEPVFGNDIGYWIFNLPFYDAIQGVLWGGIVTGLVVTIAVGALCAAAALIPEELPVPLRPPKGVSSMDGFTLLVKQAGILLMAVFVLAAAGSHFGVYHLATSVHGDFVGPDATERDVLRPVLGALQWVALALAVVTGVFVARRWRASSAIPTAITLGALLGGWLLLAGLLQAVPAAIYSRLRVDPNANTLQIPFVTDYLTQTRAGWQLQPTDNVETRTFGDPGKSPPAATVTDLAADPGTLQNALVQDPGNIPSILDNIDKNRRAYQSYPSVAVDRYKSPDGSDQAVILGPREIQQADLPSQSFSNQSFVFTHGFGVTAVSVNQLQSSRDPAILLGGQPPTLSPGAPASLLVPDPRIYCGLQTTHPVLVNSTQKEFDFVGSNGDQFNQYGSVSNDGSLAVPGILDRLAISLDQFAGLDLVLTSSTTPESRILLHREVKDRVHQLAPWLSVNSDPYIVADQDSGHYVWIVDGNVKTDLFPESFRDTDGTSYMRNAVKAVVDARTCQTTLYAVDPKEPLTAAYSDIYPGLLRPLSEMSAGLRAHLRYPMDFFAAQTRAFAQAHIDPRQAIDLYTGTDVFRLSQESGSGSVNGNPTESAPHYVELVLPGETQPRFVLLQTFSPRQSSGGGSSNAMTEWLAARCDYTSSGTPKLVAVPLGGAGVQGLLQFDQKLNTNTAISQTVTLLNGSGSSVTYGNVIALPFNNRTFLYVRALYVSANSRAYPQVNKILVGTQDTVALGDTLDDALRVLFTGQDVSRLPTVGGAKPTGGPTPSGSPSPSPSPGGTAQPSASASPAAGAPLQLTPQEAAILQDLIQRQAALQGDLSSKNYDAYARDEAAAQRDIDQLRQLLGPGFAAGLPSASPSASPSP